MGGGDNQEMSRAIWTSGGRIVRLEQDPCCNGACILPPLDQEKYPAGSILTIRIEATPVEVKHGE